MAVVDGLQQLVDVPFHQLLIKAGRLLLEYLQQSLLNELENKVEFSLTDFIRKINLPFEGLFENDNIFVFQVLQHSNLTIGSLLNNFVLVCAFFELFNGN